MSAVKLPEIAPLTPKAQSAFYIYHLNFLDNIPLLLAGAEIIVFILLVDVYQTMEFQSERVNKGLV